MKILIDIYLTFFKISSTTFGGGMAMFPILQRDIVKDKEWVTDEEIVDFYALSQGLPGIIAVNVSTLIGYKKKGILGAIAAGLGIVSPCIIIIMFIATFISNFKNLQIVKHVFAGITVGVSALIFNSVVNLWKKTIVDKFCILLFALTFILMFILDISPVLCVIISALIGILIKNIEVRI